MAGERETYLWYLSFGRPADQGGWAGCVLTEAPDPMAAIQKAWRLKINPGGEVLAYVWDERTRPVPQEARDRLITDQAELERYCGPSRQVTTEVAVEAVGASDRVDLGTSNAELRPHPLATPRPSSN